MDKRIAIVVLFSLTVAVAASYIVYAMLVRHIGPGNTVALTQAVVAAHDLPMGSVIHETDLTTADIPAPIAGSLASKQEIIGRGITSGIYKGEPILEARLSAKGAGGGLAGLIPSGLRAAAVRVNEVVGVSGFVRPGMHVDVITSGAPPDVNQRSVGTISRIVLQNIEVLSAGQDLDHDREGKPLAVQVVNLLVTPQQAETLTLASEAKVQLILRNPLDTQIAITPGTNTAAMFSGGDSHPPQTLAIHHSPNPAVRPAAPPMALALPPQTVEIVNGAKRETFILGNANQVFRQGAAQ